MMTIVCTSRSAGAQKRNLRKPRSVLNSSRVDSKSFLLSASSFFVVKRGFPCFYGLKK